MKQKQVLSAVIGAALLSGTAFAQAQGPQGQGPRGDGPGMRPPCEGQEGCPMMQGRRPEGMGGPGMRRGGPGQEGCPGMMQGQRPEGMGGPGMRRGGPGPQAGREAMPDPEQLKKAGVTDQQLEALKAMHYEQQVKRIDAQAAVQKAELALGQLMQDAKAEEKAAMKAADALTQARGELFKLEVADQVKTRQILGEEVLKKLQDQKSPEGRDRPGQCPGAAGQRPDAPPPAGEKAPVPEQK